MARTSFQKDFLNIFHGDDGEDIAEYIQSKLTSDQYNINVNLFNLSLSNKYLYNKCVQIIFLTPEVYKKLNDGKMTELLGQLKNSCYRIMLYHSSTDIQREDVKQTIADKIDDSDSWKFIPLGNSDKSFKKALLEILNTVESSEVLPVLKQFMLAPTSIWNTDDDVFIFLKKEVSSETLEVRITDAALERKVETLRQINATTFVFTLAGFASGKKKVEVFLDGKPAGRSSLEIKQKLDMLYQLLQDVVNPIELLCQTLNIESSIECLDLELNDIFTNGGTNPLAEYANEALEYSTDMQKQSELPTLLHFGAKYGLEHFCSTLLTFPGGKTALRIKNKDGRTPYKLAIFSGFTDLADHILLTTDDNETQDVKDEEDHYMTMEASVKKSHSARTIRPNDIPKLPPRSQSFDSREETIDSNYANVVLRRDRKRSNSEKCTVSTKDSGHWTDDSAENLSGIWEATAYDVVKPTRQAFNNEPESAPNMTARMTKLLDDNEVKLPESTKL